MNPYESPNTTETRSPVSRASRFAGIVVYGSLGYALPLLIVVTLIYLRNGGSIAGLWAAIVGWHSFSLGMFMLGPSLVAMTMFGIAGYHGLFFWKEGSSPKRAALLGILVLIAVAVYSFVILNTTWMQWRRSPFVDALIYPAFVGSVPLLAFSAMVMRKAQANRAKSHPMDSNRGAVVPDE